jgi:hypothetical protein
MCQRRGTGPEIAVRKCTLGNPDLPRLIRRTRRQHGRPFNHRTFQRMLDKKIADGFDVGEFWRTGQDVWDWWVSPTPVKEDEAQLTIFE